MSPIPKVAWLVAGSAVVLVTYDVRVLVLIAGVGLACAASAGLTVRLARTLAGFAPLGASILLVQLVLPTRCAPSCEVLATVGPMDIYADAMARGLSLLARLLALEVVAFTIVLATRAPDVIASLDRVRVPRHVSFVVALTLQLVPVLRRELAIVLDAQRARGLRAGGPTALTRAVIPVIVASVERIERLAMSLEARGFGGPIPRTSWRAVSFDAGDRIVTLAGIVAGVAGVVAGLAWWGPSASSVAVSPTAAVVIALGALAVFVAMLLRAAVAVMRV
jgi:energy-coupling factor transport system permease protein